MPTTIPAPRGFRNLGDWLDFNLLDDPKQDVIEYALDSVTRADMREVRTYLAAVLAAALPRKPLQQAWRNGQSNILIPDDDELRAFMAEIIRRIDLRLGMA